MKSTQNWIPFKKINENGIVKMKEKEYIKILKVTPINFNLKTNFEKEAILNSYKIFLKTCNMDIQILIQSNKEDLTKHIEKIKNLNKKEKKEIIIISNKYIEYIQELNKNKKSSTKNFYIIIKEKTEKKKEVNESLVFDKLNESYFKIKECLGRCGNIITDCDKEETEKIINSFYNIRKELYII